ncbi:MAG: tRNA lysidine(34) synthetase TilS [Spongiibacteraceae bacterium]
MSTLSAHILQQLKPFLTARRWLVAYSGGVDSHVLLHLLAHLPAQPNTHAYPLIEAVHINHQLQAPSAQWAQHCQQQCDSLGLVLHSVAVDVAQGSRRSLEEQARKARYQVFEALMQPGDVLLMGHHLDDQVETLMLRMLRGSGSKGMAAMLQTRALACGQLTRPLLDTPRAHIEAYAAAHQLAWIEDPSNQQTDFDRNFLRLQLLPVLAQRWPQYRQTLARAAMLSEESAQLNTELAALDFNTLGLSSASRSIPLRDIVTLSPARQKNLLRYWLQCRQFAMPSAAQLQAVLTDVIAAQQDAEPLLEWEGVQIRRFKDKLYAMEPLIEVDINRVYRWDLMRPLQITGVGSLSVKATIGEGISTERLKNAVISVCFRQGGERSQPVGRAHSQTLKKLLQEHHIEPWLRHRLPLLYCDGELIAVADLWVCQGWQAAAGEPGYNVCWLRI